MVITTVMVVAVAAYQLWERRAIGKLTVPYAVWREGKISEIRNCDGADQTDTVKACIELHCRAEIAGVLADSEHAVIGVGAFVDGADIRYVRIVGPVQYVGPPPPTRPNGYECEMEGWRVVNSRIFHAR